MTIKELAQRATESHLDDNVEMYLDLAIYVKSKLVPTIPLSEICERIINQDPSITYSELERLGKCALYLLE